MPQDLPYGITHGTSYNLPQGMPQDLPYGLAHGISHNLPQDMPVRYLSDRKEDFEMPALSVSKPAPCDTSSGP